MNLNEEVADAIVFTPLQEEADAFLQICSPSSILRKGHDLRLKIRSNTNKESIVYLICPNAMGKTEAAISVTRACLIYQPKLVIVCGRAGGLNHIQSLSRKLSVGDVVVTTKIVDLDIRKILNYGEDDIRPKMPDLTGWELSCAERVAHTSWWRYIDKDQVSSEKLSRSPLVHFGSVISGSVVLSSETAQAEIAEHFFEYNRVLGKTPIAIEMEGIGAAVAVERLRSSYAPLANLRIIMIRGISDFADSKKSSDEKKGRFISSENAASFCRAYLARYFERPLRYKSDLYDK